MGINSPLFKCHNKVIKRVVDVTIAILLLISLFPPVLVILFFIIKITDRGEIFFKQKRVGYKREVFTIYKFRSMNKNSELTPYGNFIRKSYLDELPQIFNVLKGEMSLVGPRPHAVEEDLIYMNKFKEYNLRYYVLPGITGWAQVNGYNGKINDNDALYKRIEYDLWYIKNWSIWLEFKIIFLTLCLVIKDNFKFCQKSKS